MYMPSGTNGSDILYFHGGDWSDDVPRRRVIDAGACLCRYLQRLLRSIEYVANNAGFLSVDPDRIATAGSGTDGNLRSVVSLACAVEAGCGSPYR